MAKAIVQTTRSGRGWRNASLPMTAMQQRLTTNAMMGKTTKPSSCLPDAEVYPAMLADIAGLLGTVYGGRGARSTRQAACSKSDRCATQKTVDRARCGRSTVFRVPRAACRVPRAAYAPSAVAIWSRM
jgi:hypothetical protein